MLLLLCAGFVLYQRLWKCGPISPDQCASCVASGAAVASGQGRASLGEGPAHLRCRLLRARVFAPVFGVWWLTLIVAITLRFNRWRSIDRGDRLKDEVVLMMS
jgi:hypothetical protein